MYVHPDIYNMAVDLPFHVWRVMNSQKLKQLQICLLLMLLPTLQVMAVQANSFIIAKSGCNDSCGNVSIPFPFGIGANCSLDGWFEIECKASPNSNSSMVKPFLSKFNIEVIEISIHLYDFFGVKSVTVRIPPLRACSGETQAQQNSSIDLRDTENPYFFSEDNVFMMEGCPGSAALVNENSTVVAGCGTVCHNNNSAMPTNGCYGVQCCQTPLPDYFSFYQIDFNLQGSSQSCLAATLIKSDSVDQYAGKLLSTSDSSSSSSSSSFPAVLDWNWISSLQADNDSHASCSRDDDTLSCECNGNNYYGNPYVSNGCQVPEDCKGCQGVCFPLGSGEWQRSPIPDAFHCYVYKPRKLAVILGPSISFGVVLLVIGLYRLYRFIKRRREMKRRAKFFKRNGGLLLQQQLSSNEGIVEETKIFTISELDKATDHFNENRILGQGGQGTVYKGMLADGRIVAIKKAKLLDESQLEQFINEVVILSQINHRNVVKLLGCCLETEVPLLVYEFVPNGTLSEHIHDPDEDFVVSWEMRVKIAADSAAAIAYLHSSSSIPIYHRDIKSSNILLDEKHRAKVSDFGSSKTIAIDQTHLTTLVQGTMGYLDPEYFQSYQFTEKSDVYSFGVVLLEILTSKNPIYRDASTAEQKNLVTEFLFLIENSGLSNILDPEIVKQAKEKELITIVELAKSCTSWSGKLRPTMKEVAMTLEMIMNSPSQVPSCYQQAFTVPHEGFAENAMTEASHTELMSNPLSAGAAIQPHTI